MNNLIRGKGGLIMGIMHTKAERTEKVKEIKAENEKKVKEVRAKKKELDAEVKKKAKQVAADGKKSRYYIQTVYACYCTGNCYGTGAYYNYNIES